MLKQLQDRRGSDEGFTLIELLIAIVVIGVLSAVVIVGIGGLTNNGKAGACAASRDATKAGMAVHYSNNAGAYPATVQTMVTAKELELSGGTTVDVATGLIVTGTGWNFTYTPAVAANPAAIPPVLAAPPVIGACVIA